MNTSAERDDAQIKAWLNHDKTIFTQKLVDIQLEHWAAESEEDMLTVCAIAEQITEVVYEHFTQKDPS